jgi:surface antigen
MAHRRNVTSRAIRALLIIFALLSLSVMIAGPANATGTYLCTGYAGCAAAGAGNAGYSSASGTSYWGMDPGHNCTNYVAYRLIQNGIDASYLRGQGNAYQWGGVAGSHGVAIDSNPRVGDIAWWDANSGGSGSLGHVAYVEQVGNGYVVTSEDNDGGDFHWVKLTPAGYYPTGFIHFGVGGYRLVDVDSYGGADLILRRGNQWFVDLGADGGNPDRSFSFGDPGDQAFIGNVDGAGWQDILLRRGNQTFVDLNSDGTLDRSFLFGAADDQVVTQ